MTQLELFIEELRQEFPEFKIIPKSDSKLMKLCNLLLKILSIGLYKKFLSDYTSTIGHTIYTPSRWESISDISKIILLRHERVHMRQEKRMGKIWYHIAYLLVFFPIGLAFMRAKMEKEAYAETIRAQIEYRGVDMVLQEEYVAYIVSQFTGPGYMFMWPFKKSIEKWMRNTIEDILTEKFIKESSNVK